MIDTAITVIGGSAIAVAAVAWLCRSLLQHLLSKDVDKFRLEIENSNARNIEAFRSSMELEAQRQMIEFGSLHERRANLIAELYAKAVALQNGFLSLTYELGKRAARLEVHNTKKRAIEASWILTPGIDTLSIEEEKKAKDLQEKSKEFFGFYSTNKIYFSTSVCELIDSFATLSSYVAVMYENVAIRDYEGELKVNPLVEEVWNKSGNRIPELLKELEKEFRELLGVAEKSTEQATVTPTNE